MGSGWPYYGSHYESMDAAVLDLIQRVQLLEGHSCSLERIRGLEAITAHQQKRIEDLENQLREYQRSTRPEEV